MAPLAPHSQRPSHPDILEVIEAEADFNSKSFSQVALPPFAVFAKLGFPPCTVAEEPTYATVQTGTNSHLNLNSDLLYINHSCEPSLIFDMANMVVLVGPRPLQPGDELTFFYPSTEWDMAQPFDCLCGKPTCRGTISGARNMTLKQLEGIWLNGHIRELLGMRGFQSPQPEKGGDRTAQALRYSLAQAEKAVEAARHALCIYVEGSRSKSGRLGGAYNRLEGGVANGTLGKAPALDRRGPTSRELSGEMGGDTVVA